MSHCGQTFLYENGAFRLPNGVAPESAIRRFKEYASYVEGILWLIAIRRESRNGVDISADLGRISREITTRVPRGGDCDTKSETDGTRAGARGKSGNAHGSPWMGQKCTLARIS